MGSGTGGKHEIVCPCCDTRLVIDAATGEILSEERPKRAPEKTFDQALSEVRGARDKADKEFARKFEQTRNEKELLAKKFEEAMKKAEKNKDAPPPHPFDRD
jgi:uncharacterized membrane protein YkoI